MRTTFQLKNLSLLLAGILMTLTTSCDKEEAKPTYKLSDFTGSWIATSLVQTSNEDSGQSFDMIANGAEVRFTLLPGGGVRTWVEFGTFSDEWDALAELSGNTITSTPEESSRGVNVFTFEYDGTTLKMTNTNDSFDFTLTGENEVATTSVAKYVRH